MTDRQADTEETLSVAWCPLGPAHELMWKISLMEEVGESDPDVALSRDETPCQLPVCGMRALPSASHSDSTLHFFVLLRTETKTVISLMNER